MQTSKLLISFALLPLGCVQGGQTPPPPPPAATATVAPAEAVEATSVEPPEAAASAEAADLPTVAATARPAAPRVEPTRAPAPKPTAPAADSPRPAPTAAAPTSAPAPAPERVRLIVPAGTRLPLEIETTLSSATSQPGDPVVAVLTEDVPLDGFKLDQGSEVRGRVVAAVPAKRVKGQARLAVSFDAVMKNGEKLSITTEAIDNMAASTGGKDKKIIAGGAVGGLILGAIKDGKKGAAIGTVLGAAAGTGAVLIMKGDEVELPRGTRVTLTVLP